MAILNTLLRVNIIISAPSKHTACKYTTVKYNSKDPHFGRYVLRQCLLTCISAGPYILRNNLQWTHNSHKYMNNDGR